MPTQPRGRFIDTNLTPDNLLKIWQKLHDMEALLTTANQTIATQQQTIDGLNTQLTATTKTAKAAMIAAGKITGTGPVNAGTGPPTPGGGGGSGSKHNNYLTLVQQAKDDLITEGVDLSGACGGFEIVKRAVQYIAPSDPAVGLLYKPTGTNCMSYSIDRICFNDGWLYDVLFNADAALAADKTPQWNFDGTVDPSLYRPPI